MDRPHVAPAIASGFGLNEEFVVCDPKANSQNGRVEIEKGRVSRPSQMVWHSPYSHSISARLPKPALAEWVSGGILM